MREGNQCSQAPWIRQAKNGTHFGSTRKPRQGRDTGCRYAGCGGESDTQFAYRVKSHQRNDQGACANHNRTFPQLIQWRTAATAWNKKQVFQFLLLFAADALAERVPQPLLYPAT